MPFYRRSKNGKSNSYGKKKSRVGKKRVTSKNVVSIVKREVSRNIENKTFQVYRPAVPVYPSSSASFGLANFPISPYSGFLDIQQGVGQANRVGNRIKLKRLNFSGSIRPMIYDSVTNPQPQPSYVILWFYYNRDDPTIMSTPDNTFLQLGNSSQSLQNTLVDRTSPVNKDNWVLLGRKVFKCGPAINTGSGSLPAFAHNANNDFKLVCDFNIDMMKYAVKDIIYNDTSSNPRTRVIMCQPQAISAVSQFGAAYVPIQLQYVIDCQFEDA